MVEFLSILVVVVLFCYFLYYKNKKYREEQEMDRIANAPNMSVGSEVLPLNNNNMEENQIGIHGGVLLTWMTSMM